ncbi:DinB family protein [Pseudonocardia sp. C8]|uniref:DinB family protein n=1 Tax=Pseudonocardia sp. C8 TaxID=2762759 RepID=UPI0016427366|nr:DinB family protein [Pseudonocardia sp. C8]MBC3191971.1 DinB family protein [Pseudonocardia sp. C8]
MTPPTSGIDWNARLLEQLTFHWEQALRPRLDGLTDDEYFAEPVPGAWSVRRRGESVTPPGAGSGDWVCDFAFPEPVPPPVTTIAWRLAHVIVGVFGMRVQAHLGGPPVDYTSHAYAGTAAEALAQLDEQYARWTAGIAALGTEGLARPCGPAEGPYADEPLATLVLHVHREVIHHGAEIALLRDLYRAGLRPAR